MMLCRTLSKLNRRSVLKKVGLPSTGDDGMLQAAWVAGKLPAEWRAVRDNAARDIVRSKGRRSSAAQAPTPSTAAPATAAKGHSSGSAALPPTSGRASTLQTEVEPEEIVLSDKARCQMIFALRDVLLSATSTTASRSLYDCVVAFPYACLCRGYMCLRV